MAEQLNLFVETKPTGARPDKLGPAAITYSDSKTLLTPASGFMENYDFTLNPYSGCGFGCEYCYARFFAATEEARDTWGQWVKVKENAVETIRRAQRSKGRHRLERGAKIYMSSVTDPYQPVEKQLELTRRILEALIEVQPRLTIQTRSPMVTRDIDLLQRFDHVRVNITIPTDSEQVRLRYEPHCPTIGVRLETARTLRSADIPIGVSISPTLPIENPERFAEALAALDSVEYVTQYMKPPTSRFRSGTSTEALQLLKSDGWSLTRYNAFRSVLQSALGSERRLEEGVSGYRPVE